jgi:hypothetical protein
MKELFRILIYFTFAAYLLAGCEADLCELFPELCDPGEPDSGICVPDVNPCEGLECGEVDDGCDEGNIVQCGSCDGSAECIDNVCIPCESNCGDKICGEETDSCGNGESCGTCESGTTCSPDQMSCEPNYEGPYSCGYVNNFDTRLDMCTQYPSDMSEEDARAACYVLKIGGVFPPGDMNGDGEDGDTVLVDSNCADYLDGILAYYLGYCTYPNGNTGWVEWANMKVDDCNPHVDFTAAWGCEQGGDTFTCIEFVDIPEDPSITCGAMVCGLAVNNLDMVVHCGTCDAGTTCSVDQLSCEPDDEGP